MTTKDRLIEMENEFEKLKKTAELEFETKINELTKIAQSNDKIMRELEERDYSVTISSERIAYDSLSSDYHTTVYDIAMSLEGKVYIRKSMSDDNGEESTVSMHDAMRYMDLWDIVNTYKVIEQAIDNANKGVLEDYE